MLFRSRGNILGRRRHDGALRRQRQRLRPSFTIDRVRACPLFFSHKIHCCIQQLIRAYRGGCPAHLHRGLSVEQFPSANHFQGAGEADNPRCSHRASAAGDKPELDIGETELGFRMLCEEPPIAPSCHLGTTSKAQSLDCRDSDKGLLAQLRQNLLTAPKVVKCLLGRLHERQKFLHSETRRKVSRFAGADNQSCDPILLRQQLQVIVEFFQSCQREGVCLAIRNVKR